MPAPIAFNTGSQTAGTLKVARLEYSISSSIGSGSANLRWFPTVNPGPYGLIFATSNFTQSYGTYQASTPLFYTASNTVAGIISASNRLPDRYNQTQFTTTASALEWIASSGKYFMMNYEYPQIVSDKLVYLVDSTLLASYPQTGTTTYPIQNTPLVGVGTLQNGVAWDFTSRTFDFDGSDDQILINTSDRFGDLDWSKGITVMVLYKIDAVTDFNGQFRAFIGVTGGNRSFNYYLYGASNPATTLQYHFSALYSSGLSNSLTISADRYHLGIFTCDSDNAIYYHNGASVGTQGAGTPAYYTAGGPQYLGRADNFAKGNIARWALYNKALTQAEVLQNLYQGNIVTDGLILAYDSSNLVSYPGSGTTWYDMSENGNHGTISNGEFIPSSFGGYLRNANNESNFFYITIPNSTSLSNTLSVTTGGWTIEEIIWTNSTNYPEADAGSVFSDPAYGPGATGFDWNHGYGIDQFQFGQSSNSATGYEDTVVVSSIPSQYAQFNTWRIRTMIWDRSNNTVSLYINGVYIGGGNTPNTAGQAIYDGDGGSIGTLYGWKFYGRRGAFKIWNKVLSSSEIIQNFNAQKNRFGL